jgi:hypothetical protein
MRAESYTANTLNQYASKTMAGAADDMGVALAAQVEAVEVADGHLHAVVARVVGGGAVSVAVEGEAFVAGPFGNVDQTIGQRPGGAGEEGVLDVAEEGETLEAGVCVEIVATLGRGVEAGAVFLEEGAAAGDVFEDALEAEAEPVFVGELQAGRWCGLAAARPARGWRNAASTLGDSWNGGIGIDFGGPRAGQACSSALWGFPRGLPPETEAREGLPGPLPCIIRPAFHRRRWTPLT